MRREPSCLMDGGRVEAHGEKRGRCRRAGLGGHEEEQVRRWPASRRVLQGLTVDSGSDGMLKVGCAVLPDASLLGSKTQRKAAEVSRPVLNSERHQLRLSEFALLQVPLECTPKAHGSNFCAQKGTRLAAVLRVSVGRSLSQKIT